ncbi:MAG TPA: type II toxin-antitoxin system HicB family antitoxin [Chitinophagaceae bacterium]|jgi:predicted RNase H-like HicB family nuclease|nr:type II toxin-antitoxin system HicB family antitoxin [Chitinophagaceae bacterium]
MKNTYQIVVNWSNAGQAFLADVPELSGCIADGKSFEEAIENVKIIMEEYLATPASYGKHSSKQKSSHYYA